MFAYSVVFFSSSAYLFYHSWKYLSTHFSRCVLAFMTLCVASFVFLCRKYIFTHSKKNNHTKNERSNLERLLRSISIFRTVFYVIFQNPFSLFTAYQNLRSERTNQLKTTLYTIYKRAENNLLKLAIVSSDNFNSPFLTIP